MIPPLVYIEWEDAHELDLDTGWVHTTDHTYQPVIVHQVGYILAETPEAFILTAAWHPDFIGPRTAIPRAMVTKLCPLKVMQPAFIREGHST
jgi:hypothetical protein